LFSLLKICSQIPILKRVLTFIILLTLLSCSRSHVYEKYEPVKQNEWKYNEAISFPVEIKDDNKLYNIYVSVRHGEEYPFSNLWVQLLVKKPGNIEENKRFSLSLAEQDGRWFGTRLGSIYDISPFLVLKNYPVPKKGLYNFILRHAMRQDIVPGIMDVGIRVEEAK
jgi:gliding motility-associated lipoprotein GldH